MSFSNLLTEKKGGVMIITINRPEKLNALNRDTIHELNLALNEAQADEEVRCILLTGSGQKAFVAGADISEFAHFSVEEGRKLSHEGQLKLFDKIENLHKPVIAAVNGFALGGGLELAMACHIRIASDNARLGLPEVSLGVIPGYGGTQRLPILIGRGRANQLIFSAEMISAETAASWGLVNKSVPQDQLMAECEALAEKICKNSPKAIGLAIEAVNAGFEDGVDGFEVEIDAFGRAFGTEDFKEGTSAFLEKRKPAFSGR
jgi:enoyl-CoA hydratase